MNAPGSDTPPTDRGMRVLVATDGSAAAGVAVDLAAGIPWPNGTTILVARAVATGAALYGGPWPAVTLLETADPESEARADAERMVHAIAQRLTRPGVAADGVVLAGRAPTAIVDRARETSADLIVVASRGHGVITSMVLGSVSAEIVDHASRPVLVARGTGIERVVLGWDGSDFAGRAADLVQTWPIFGGSRVRVVSVADIAMPWWTGVPAPGAPDMISIYHDAADQSRREYEGLARDMAAKLGAAGLASEAEMREGDPATEILAAARESNADLIVVGTHGRTGLARLLVGSVARNVLHHATCSVLVVRDVPRAS